MFKLHNWVQELVQSFTFYGGGGSGGGGSSTSKTTNELDPTVRPFVEYGLGEAKNLYQTQTPTYYPGQTYVSPSTQTTQALNLAEQRALTGNPLVSSAQQQQFSSIVTGKQIGRAHV